jgi:hypothetical protein
VAAILIQCAFDELFCLSQRQQLFGEAVIAAAAADATVGKLHAVCGTLFVMPAAVDAALFNVLLKA